MLSDCSSIGFCNSHDYPLVVQIEIDLKTVYLNFFEKTVSDLLGHQYGVMYTVISVSDVI